MERDLTNYLISLETKGVRLGLHRTKELLKRCGSPHKQLQIIQIIGTNGKGSTGAIISGLLKTKYKVGLYTSPHLVSYRERIRVQGNVIPTKEVDRFIKKYRDDISSVGASFFETMTVMAVWYFKHQKVDFAILETGLGGRHDSVTACRAQVQAFTSISIDHAHILGPTLLDIANEKIAAISYGAKVYSVRHSLEIQEAIKKRCFKQKAELIFINQSDEKSLSLRGKHQMENASLAKTIVKHILPDLSQKELEEIFATINWPGRNQMLSKIPDIIFDVAHNHAGFESFYNYIHSKKNKKYDKKILLLSLQKNKEIEKIGPVINRMFDLVYYTKTCPERSMDFEMIKKHIPNAEIINIPEQAIQKVSKTLNKADLMAILGTHYWGEYIKNFFNICFDNI